MRAIFSKGASLNQIPRAWAFRAAVLGLLATFVLLDFSLLERKSMMVDDVIHIPSGYSYLKTHDFRLNQEHPPLLKVLSGIGLQHVRPDQLLERHFHVQRVGDVPGDAPVSLAPLRLESGDDPEA